MLEADSPDDVDDASLRQFRVMAGLDREPLLAYVKAPGVGRARPRSTVSTCRCCWSWATTTRTPAIPRRLAERLGATLVRVPGDHFTANSRPELHRALTEFLGAQ